MINMRIDDNNDVNMRLLPDDELDFGLGTVYVTKDHTLLDNRDASGQHPIGAITGLTDALTQLQDNIDNLVPANALHADSADFAGKAVKLYFGQLASDSTSTVMKAAISGITALEDGVVILLKNGVVTSASGVTLDINGLGAKKIHYSMAADTAVTTVFNVNYTALLYYDSARESGSGAWVFYYGYYTSTNSIGYQLRTNTMRLPVSSTCYRYRLLFTRDNGYELMPANNSTSTNATSARTPCNEIFDPFGPIYYYGYTTALSAGGKPGSSYYWQQYIVTLGYSFTAIVLTESKPVYVVATPTTNGMAILDSQTPVTQTLPTSNDGKIYIFMGIATSTTAFELMDKHPIYYHDGSMLQHYKG